MITISLWQPHATAMFVRRLGAPGVLKTFETRGWTPSPKLLKPGQTLAIHAAKTQIDTETREPLRDWFNKHIRDTELGAAFAAMGYKRWDDLPFGCVLGHGVFNGAFPTETLRANKAIDAIDEQLGNYGPRRFGWQMQQMVPLDAPVACRGMQTLFEWNPIPSAPEAFELPGLV